MRNKHAAWGLLLCLLLSSAAHGQVDTPAARAARAALAAVEQTYGSSPSMSARVRRLPLADVNYELRAGDRAEPEPLVATAAELRKGAKSAFREPAFQKLAAALEARAAELAAMPPGEWSAACLAQAHKHAPLSPQDVQAERRELLKRLDALEQRLPALNDPKDVWRKFLSWTATRSLIYTDERDPELLDRLEARWQGAPSVWDAPELAEASLAVQRYIRLYRGYLANESAQRYAAAWTELGKLLESHATAAGGNAARIAELVNGRERLGQGSTLTTSIRREFSRPNMILQARVPWVQAQLAQRINDRFNVNDVYAGARTVGTGTISAAMSCELLPSSAVARANLRFDGTSNARTSGSSEGVSVSSRATTRMHGVKPFVLDRTGLHTSRAAASANTSIAYDSIDAPGLRRRRSESIRQTYARRPQAEADAEAAARREVTTRMDQEGNKLVEDFNKSYAALRDRQFDAHRRAPEMRVRVANNVMRWECRLESPALFAAPTAPPAFSPDADATLCIASSAMEEQCLITLAGRQMNGEELSKAIAELLGQAAGDDKSGLDFSATFARHPCDIRFVEGQIRAKFYITSFDSADVQYPAMTVDAEYDVQQRQGDLALVRKGSLRVRPLSVDGGAPTISGRQQTLRLAVQRKLNKAFAPEFLWSGPTLPVAGKDAPKLAIERAQVEGGWLQLSLRRQDAPAKPAQSTARLPR